MIQTSGALHLEAVFQHDRMVVQAVCVHTRLAVLYHCDGCRCFCTHGGRDPAARSERAQRNGLFSRCQLCSRLHREFHPVGDRRYANAHFSVWSYSSWRFEQKTLSKSRNTTFLLATFSPKQSTSAAPLRYVASSSFCSSSKSWHNSRLPLDLSSPLRGITPCRFRNR